MAKLTSVISWVCMMVTMKHVSGYCGNTVTDTDNVKRQIIQCRDDERLYFGPEDANALHKQLTNLCSDLECRLECIETAIDNCDQTNDFYVTFDRQIYKAAYRGLCANKTVSESTITNCSLGFLRASISCSPAFKVQLAQMKQYQQAGNAELYKQIACSAFVELASCMNIAPSGQCTQTNANFMNLFLQTSYSYPSTCNHSSDNQFFRDYSYPVKCTGPVTMGGSGTMSFAVSLLLLSCIGALFKYV